MKEIYDMFKTSKAAPMKKVRKKPEFKERKLQLMCCDWLHRQYPSLHWACDLSSGMNLPTHIAATNKRMRSGRGMPDVVFHEPSELFHGLMIELKADDSSPWLKDGSLRENKHVKEQEAVLQRFRDKGYKAEFACGFDQFMDLVNSYFRK